MSSTLESADERLLNAHDLARAALLEITPESTIGEPVGHTIEEGGVVSLRFRNHLSGYPGWLWTVSVAVVDDAEPTVLEVELLPGEGALVAPEWVPWAVRLAEYQAAQAALAEAGELDEIVDEEDIDDAEVSDLDDLDAVDFDEDGSSLLHSGDVDGVDIDELDVDAAADLDEADEAGEELDEDEPGDEGDDSAEDDESDDVDLDLEDAGRED